MFVLFVWTSLLVFGQTAHPQFRDQSWRIQERVVEFNLDETSPVGTELGSVAAPLNPSKSMGREFVSISELHYRLGAPSSLFVVNEQTGVLSTRAAIDAEELCVKAREQDAANTNSDQDSEYSQTPSRVDSIEKSIFDRLTCSQDGHLIARVDVNALLPDASLLVVHRVAVHIHDLNDNGPKFDQLRWHRRLKEILYRKGRRLELPKAQDADLLAEHRRILYRLQNMNNTELIDTGVVPFRLEVNPNGQPILVLTEDLDAETTRRHRFVLVAYSPSPIRITSTAFAQKITSVSKMSKLAPIGSTVSEARLEIDIEVADMNDNEPRFDSSSYNTSVPEDAPLDTVIYQLVAHDPDSTAQLTYRMGMTMETGGLNSTFVVDSDGRVRLRSALNYELRHTYKLPVEVTDGEFGAQSVLHVHVLDVNDEAPSFEINPKVLQVEENVSPGKLIGRVRVYDTDGKSVNGEVRCFEPAYLKRQQAVIFNPDPGVNPSSDVYDLTTRLVLDREAIDEPSPKQLFVYLICVDGYEMPGSLSSPRFNPQHTSTMTATLIVRDDNDHSPVFNQTTYHASMRENNLIGEKIIQIQATDEDEGDNAHITYALLDKANFKVDSLTGWITANVVFDRETRDSYEVVVVAMDQGKPRLSTSVLLNITILDVNDHAPVLPYEGEMSLFHREHISTGRVEQRNIFAVQENEPQGTYLGNVLASDNDLGLNSELVFELLDDSVTEYHKRFKLSDRGLLHTAASLDREEKDHYRLAIRVSDKAETNPLTTTGAIDVIVQDVNDNSPRFVFPTGLLSPAGRILPNTSARDETFTRAFLSDYVSKGNSPQPTIHLSMSEEPGHVVTKLKAEDLDAGVNGHVMYYMDELASPHIIGPHTGKPLLKIDLEQGSVILQRFMSSNDLGMWFFHVRAVDNGQPTARADSKVLALLIVDQPVGEVYAKSSHSSNYYPINGTSYAFRLWSFGGPRNTIMVSLLASISGLLAAILIIAIACVLHSKRRRAACCRARRRRRTNFSSVNGLNAENHVTLASNSARNGTNGSFIHQDLGHVMEPNGTNYTGPSGGINLSVLLEDWQPSRSVNGGGGNGFAHAYPHYQAVEFPGGSVFCTNESHQSQNFPQHAMDHSWRQSILLSKESGIDEQPTSDSGRGGSEEEEQANSYWRKHIDNPIVRLPNVNAMNSGELEQTSDWPGKPITIECVRPHPNDTTIHDSSPYSVHKDTWNTRRTIQDEDPKHRLRCTYKQYQQTQEFCSFGNESAQCI
ncbi:Protocadherin gamma-B5 [Fasciola gigantica]|uniref:Protocadherin gamma-B5 n=1 Tax=Fasciola gigantica TaxID=46835 RepID=A0A504YQG7_FASGI|nr:Protocadherin gamma-B5 [Fasciola gigantica]